MATHCKHTVFLNPRREIHPRNTLTPTQMSVQSVSKQLRTTTQILGKENHMHREYFVASMQIRNWKNTVWHQAETEHVKNFEP